jgi:hypothetical protein
MQLTSIQKKYIDLGRQFGVDVITGIRDSEPEGCATLLDDETFQVVIEGNPASPMFLFVLFHEYAHIALGHVGKWTSEPSWAIEYAADKAALLLIYDLAPETYNFCEQDAKRHIRVILQPWIDDHLDHHLYLEIIDWCGAKISAAHRKQLQDRENECDAFGAVDEQPNDTITL